MKKIVFILLIASSFAGLKSQNIKLIEATQQSWAGGECCTYGINYMFTLESADTIQSISLDTVWIGNTPHVFDKKQMNYLEKSIVNERMVYKLHLTESWNGREAQGYKVGEGYKIEEKPITLCPYPGKATLVFYYQWKKETLTVENFTVLASIAYP